MKLDISECNFQSDSKIRRSRSSRRIKAYWENIKICNVGVQYINSIPAGQKDPRPFLPVQVFNRTVYGLLDSGASISCVGGRLAEEIKASGYYKKIKGHATTADGRSQQILGHLKVEVEYIDKKSTVKLYVVPSLKQD